MIVFPKTYDEMVWEEVWAVSDLALGVYQTAVIPQRWKLGL